MKPLEANASYAVVQSDIVALLEAAHRAAARTINSLMTATYWEIGRRIVEFEQGGRGRAEYGEVLIGRLSQDLGRHFGRGFSAPNLRKMRSFHIAWPREQIWQTVSAKSGGGAIRSTLSSELATTDILPTASGESRPPEIRQTVSGESSAPEIVQTLSAQLDRLPTLAQAFPLPWSAYVRLLAVKSDPARRFYEAEAVRCGWSVRQLNRQIESQFYERTALSRNKTVMLQQAETPDSGTAVAPEQAIKDPFVLEFLNLKDEYSESDFEEALIHHLADFLLELGDDFAFVGRQRRLRIDDGWFRVDLLLFHRRLHCLLVVDLKVGRFSHADAGQMHMYLNYAREHWMKPGENPPAGRFLPLNTEPRFPMRMCWSRRSRRPDRSWRRGD